MSLYTIWDIDNCLADDHWRQGSIEWDKEGDARYDKYNELSISDNVKHVETFMTFRKMGARPIFFTGRHEGARAITIKWLITQRGLQLVLPEIYMRARNTSGITPKALKQAMLESFLETLNPDDRIIGAFDDIPVVVEMYRTYGIPAAQLIINEDLSKVYTPEALT